MVAARRVRRALLASVAAVALGAVVVGPVTSAEATPRLTIDQARSQLQALNRQAADAVEVLNGLKVAQEAHTKQVADRQAAVVAAQQRTAAAGAVVDALARQAYTGGGYSGVVSALGASSPEEFLDRLSAADQLGQSAAASLAAAKAQSTQLAAEQDQLDQDQSILSQAVAATAAQKIRLAQAMASTRDLLASLRAEERARLAAEAEAARQAEMAAARGIHAGSASYDMSVVTPEYAAKAKIAVDYALSQVGGIYSMNAHPPDTWDCSKLTAYAWGRAGVSLVPYSYTQWQQTDRVPQDQLQPGDLLFYFEKGAHHVEMYIGNGMAVSASNPGVGVELQTDPFGGWYGEHYSGAGRVRL